MSENPGKSPAVPSNFANTRRRRVVSLLFSPAARLFRFLIRTFPRGLNYALIRFFARLVAWFCERERKIAEAQIRVAFGYEAGTAKNSNLVTAAFEHVAIFFVETLILDKLTRTTADTTADGFPVFELIDFVGDPAGYVRTVARRGKGVLALSGHIGPFEILAAAQAKFGTKIATIGRLPNYISLAEYAAELRHNYGVITIWREDPAAAKQFLRQIRTGGIMAVLIDQDVDIESIHVPFFGIEAGHPVPLIQLAVKLKIPICITLITRERNGRYSIHDREIKYDPADPDAVVKIVAEYSGYLEQLIRAYPEQWIWWHRRWRRRPGIDYSTPDALPGSKKYIAWLNSLPAGRAGDNSPPSLFKQDERSPSGGTFCGPVSGIKGISSFPDR